MDDFFAIIPVKVFTLPASSICPKIHHSQSGIFGSLVFYCHIKIAASAKLYRFFQLVCTQHNVFPDVNTRFILCNIELICSMVYTVLNPLMTGFAHLLIRISFLSMTSAPIVVVSDRTDDLILNDGSVLVTVVPVPLPELLPG